MIIDISIIDLNAVDTAIQLEWRKLKEEAGRAYKSPVPKNLKLPVEMAQEKAGLTKL